MEFPITATPPVKAAIGGHKVLLSITAGSLEKAEAMDIDLDVLSLSEDEAIEQRQFKLLLDLLFIGLINHYPDLTREELGRRLSADVFEDVAKAVKKMVQVFGETPEDEAGEEATEDNEAGEGEPEPAAAG